MRERRWFPGSFPLPCEKEFAENARLAGWSLDGVIATARQGATLSRLAIAITGNAEDRKLLHFKGDPEKVNVGDWVDITPMLDKIAERLWKPLESMAEEAAVRHNIPPGILKGLIRQESRWKVAAKSPVGALGLTQLMPATAKELGLRVDAKVDDRLDPAKNIDAGARYLCGMFERFYEGKTELERWRLALAAYNSGPGRVNADLGRIGKRGKEGTAEWSEIAAKAPAQTREYVQRILGESGEASGYAKGYGYGD